MKLLIDRLKEISTFVYILIFFLVFNLYFNLNYDWYGISLIVRIYLFVFSFYLIFGFASLKLDELRDEYYNIYGKKGEFLLFLEARLLPFLFIYLITIVFTLIDYIRLPDWPWNPVLSLLNGRYSNTIIYSLFLFLILKLKKGPSVTIPLFGVVFVLYFILDKYLYSVSSSGMDISLIKILKMMIFFIVLSYEFYSRIFISFIYSLVLSSFIFTSIIVQFFAVYKYSPSTAYSKIESGLQLVRFGSVSTMDSLKDLVLKTSDFNLFNKLLLLAMKFNMEIEYNSDEWKNLLFAGPVDMTELISGYIMDKEIDLSYGEIVAFAEKMSLDSNNRLEKAKTFIKISSKNIAGNEDDLIKRVQTSNKTFKLWGMAVLAEYNSIKSIPLLLELLTDVDVNISEGAYMALKKITSLDPKERLNKRINDPDIIIMFKRYYLLHHLDRIDY